MSKKAELFNSLFFSVIFGVLFTFLGGVLQGHIDWPTIPVQIIVGTVVGFIIGIVVPGGKWGAMLASKLAKQGSVLFKFVLYSTILLCMLIFMCPIITVFVACVLNGAPIAAAVPSLYSMLVPFYCAGILVLMLVGDKVGEFAVKCAKGK